MKVNGSVRRDGVGVMQQAKTWIFLYALGIAVLVLSLCQAEPEKPSEPPKPPPPVSGLAPEMMSETSRP